MSTITQTESAPPGGVSRSPRKGLTVAQRRQYGTAYALVLPFFVVFLTMIVVPLVYALYLSLFKKKLVGGTSFVGVENYVRALTDPSFLSGVGRMVLFFLVQVPIMLVLALSSPWPWTAA